MSSNYATVIPIIYGGTLDVGSTLPEITEAGWALTWYSDEGRTINNQVTTVSDATAHYYCKLGAKVAVPMTVYTEGCEVTVISSDNIDYTSSAFIPVGETITITFVETVPDNIYVLKFAVNGTNYASNYSVTQNSVTLTLTTSSPDIVIEAKAIDVTINPVISENDWSLISEVAEWGVGADYWNVGDELTIPIDGVDYTFLILGFNHDNKSDRSGKAGISFAMKHLYSTEYIMNASRTTVGGWDACEMRRVLSSTFWGYLPTELQTVIKPVIKYAANASRGIQISSVDRLWLLSEYEVNGAAVKAGGESSYHTRYAYFRDIANTASLRIKNLSNGSGTACSWWLRSPNNNWSYYYTYVGSNGSFGENYTNNQYGLCFGFCV